MEQWDGMVAWSEREFGPASVRVPGIIGQTVKILQPGARYYVDPTSFWFRNTKDRDSFINHWTQELNHEYIYC